MARTRVLNPRGSLAHADAVALSREILAASRAVTEPAECARLDTLARQLHGVDPAGIAGDAARIAFWVNLYNALVRHCLCVKPLSGSLLRHLRHFDRVAYRVGTHDYPLNLIENAILRGNSRGPFRLRRSLRRSDPRLAAAPAAVDPRIHFALNCGARSCPPIRAYAPESLDAELDLATRSYLEAETRLQPERRRVRLPRLMRIYAADFGSRDEQLRFAARYLPELGRWLEDRRQPIRVRYGRFDWTVAAASSP